MINIGLLGLGTVGTGVIEILEKQKNTISSLVNEEIRIKSILVKDANKKRNIDENYVVVREFEEIIKDPDISIIIEVTGDLEQAYDYIKLSLNEGKHVVTANKAVVSKYFEELSQLADEKGVSFLYEASVGGGIPILKPLKEELILNKIKIVQGILNGTCNYILTRMFNEGLDYGQVLVKAQELGYAEADPAADVEGDDTLRKLRILGTLALGGKIGEDDILLGGISKINSFDVRQIKLMKSTLKLIGEVKESDEGYSAVVFPTIIKEDNYFANVNMAYNSISFVGDNIGELKFYGSGAGKLPTANAVLRDVLDIAQNNNTLKNPLGSKKLVNTNSHFRASYYLRISESNEEVFSALETISKEVLSTKDNIAIITKEIELNKVLELLLSKGIKDEEYFIARILD